MIEHSITTNIKFTKCLRVRPDKQNAQRYDLSGKQRE
jgi:hypothetical protein